MKLEVGKTYLNTSNKKVTIIAQVGNKNRYIGELEDGILLDYTINGENLSWPFTYPKSDRLYREYRQPRIISGHLWCTNKQFSSFYEATSIGWQYEKTDIHTVKCKITIEEIIE